MKSATRLIPYPSTANATLMAVIALGAAGCSSVADADLGSGDVTTTSSLVSSPLDARPALRKPRLPFDAGVTWIGPRPRARLVARPLAPRSMSSVTTLRPTLSWRLPPGARAAHVDVCADRACAEVLESIDARGEHVQLKQDLPPGATYWRVRSLRAASGAGAPHLDMSATWEFFVGAGASPSCDAVADSAMGSTLDVNGDGFADGVVEASTPDRLFVFQGGVSGLAAEPSTTIDLALSGVRGAPLADAGDVDGDGFSDVVVNADEQLLLFRGGPTGLATTPSSSVAAPLQFASDRHPIAGGLDMDRDGYADVLVADRANERVLVYFGAPSGLASAPSLVLHAPDADTDPLQSFGNAIAAAGDVNADGFDDILVGAPDAAGGAGRAYLFAGGPRPESASVELAPIQTFVGPDAGVSMSRFGTDVAGSADVDGDGFADLVVGATYAPNAGAFATGQALVLRSNGGAFDLPPIVLTPPFTALSGFGMGVVALGDMDGDGLSETAVVAGINTLEAGVLGVVMVFPGTASGVAGEAAVLMDQLASGNFADVLASPGDTNGDSLRDLFVGASSSPTSQGGSKPGAGRAYLYALDATNTVSLTQTLAGEDYGVRGFGVSLD